MTQHVYQIYSSLLPSPHIPYPGPDKSTPLRGTVFWEDEINIGRVGIPLHAEGWLAEAQAYDCNIDPFSISVGCPLYYDQLNKLFGSEVVDDSDRIVYPAWSKDAMRFTLHRRLYLENLAFEELDPEDFFYEFHSWLRRDTFRQHWPWMLENHW